MIFALLFAVLGFSCLFFEFFLPGILIGLVGFMAIAFSFWLILQLLGVAFSIILFLSSGYTLLMILTIFIALKIIKKGKKRGDLINDQDMQGYQSSSFDESLVGSYGVALTTLALAGKIVIDKNIYHALSDSQFIESGESVIVTGGKSSYLIVRKI